MSYTITRANGQNPIVIADGTVDNSTSIALVGKNTPSYGQYLDQNFLNMLENFAYSNPPTSPITGQLWYDTTNGILKVCSDGTNGTFKNIASATSGSSFPGTAVLGDLWFDTTNQKLNVWNGTQWVTIGPPTSGTGQAAGEIINDTGGNPHSVISFTINNTRYAILSKDPVFQTTISGFTYVYPGFNIASTSLVSNNRLVGTATNSDALGGVGYTSFMRTDQNTSTNGTISILNNLGLNIGTPSTIGSINVTSNELHLDNVVNNGVIKLRTKNGSGVVLDALDVLGNGSVIVNYDLVVNGNLDVINSNEVGLITGTTPSYNTSTGALIVYGGIGMAGNINVGGSVNNFTGNVIVGNLQAIGTGNNGNVYAKYVNAATIGNTGATLTGTISTASQTNITSLGTLTGLQVSGAAGFTGGAVTFNPTSAYKLSLGNVGNVQINGGSTGQVLQTDGASNLSWYTIPTPVSGGATAGQIPVYTSATNIAGNAGVTYNGNLNITGNILATQDIIAFYSDVRLKTNITPITNAIEKINKINGVVYNTNDLAASLGIGDDREHIGVIAQEVQEVLPQIIHSAPFDIDPITLQSKSGENYLTVQYDKIIPLLIQAIKELSAEVEALKAAR